MPLQETSGAASYDAFGGGAAERVFIENVFSCFLYTGNGSTQTITNGIDLSTKGGLVWMKGRSGATDHALYDTTRGATKDLVSNSSAAETTQSTGLTAFNTTGFSIGALAKLNTNAATYVSWTFRKQPKFFDVVTYTGTGSNRTISHNLGSVPGCVIVKRTDTSGDWKMYHLGLTSAAYALNLNNNGSPEALEATVWNSTAPTSTVFSVGTATSVNASGGTYVAYIFAHNAGGFGLSGLDNVISCGTYNGTGGSAATTVNLGFEPQFVFISNRTYGTANLIFDSMRGIVTGGNDPTLSPSLSGAENAAVGAANRIDLNATGFTINASGYDVTDRSGSTYIYIAIRRGPMKVPTSGTSVFTPAIGNNSTSSGGEVFTTNFPVDFFMRKERATTDYAPFAYSRLTAGKYLVTGTTAAEATDTFTWFDTNTGIDYQYASNFSAQIGWLFRRAPGFFDVVCYTGDGVSTRSLTHNLGVAPELAIFKSRSYAGSSWVTFQKDVCTSANQLLVLNTNNSVLATGNFFPSGFSSSITSTTLNNIGNSTGINRSGDTYVAYLFATVAGVSKVGSYTGTGTTQVINCGFTAGSRFVMIKRTDSTGDWYVWDSARGIVAGNDPYLLLNSTAAEVTSTDYIDTAATGFEISSTAPAAINASGGTFIFLAIA